MEHEIIAMWAQVAVGIGGLILVGRGLKQMGKASEERNRQLDLMEAAQRQQADRQGEALGQLGKALERQGEVLAELLRRTA